MTLQPENMPPKEHENTDDIFEVIGKKYPGALTKRIAPEDVHNETVTEIFHLKINTNMNSTEKKIPLAAKIIVTFMGLFTAISPYLADWNVTHIYNPTWPPHAKFHNAQTMVLGALLGLLTLYALWIRTAVNTLQRLNEATVLVSLYWLAQLPAIFFPGTKLVDPGIHHVQMPVVLGVEINQVVTDIIIILPLIMIGWYSGYRKLKTN